MLRVGNNNSLEVLVRKFVLAGSAVDELSTVKCVAVTISLMSQEEQFMVIFERCRLLEIILGMMLQYVHRFPEAEIVQSCFCISVCRALLRLPSVSERKKEELSAVLKDTLNSSSVEVLAHCISGIQVLLENNICHEELLSNELIMRIAKIASAYIKDPVVARTCSAVLTVLSYDSNSHEDLSHDSVVKTVFALSRSDDILTRLNVAATLCNISVNVTARGQLIAHGVLDIVGNLSGTTNERIQELCARCICNLSCAISLHEKLIQNRILQNLLMISLVRSVANSTKQLCARGLLNMCSEANLSYVLEAGVCRAFSTLSSIPDPVTQNITARGFFWLSSFEAGRLDMIQRRATLHSLFALVRSPSPRTQSAMGKAVFNLFACPRSRRAMIMASGLSVLKILSTMDYDDIRECISQVIIGLCSDADLHPFLVRESLVPVLVLFIKNASVSFEYTIRAVSMMARFQVFHADLVQRGIVCALVSAIVAGKVSKRAIGDEICRIFSLISHTAGHASTLVHREHMLIAIHVLLTRELCSTKATDMVAATLANLSYTRAVRRALIDQDCFKIIKRLFAEGAGSSNRHRTAFCSRFILNLCKDASLHNDLVSKGLIQTLYEISVAITMRLMDRSITAIPSRDVFDSAASYGDADEDVFEAAELIGKENPRDPSTWGDTYRTFQDALLDVSSSLRLLSSSEACRHRIVEDRVVRIMEVLLKDFLNDNALYEVSCSIANLSLAKGCRKSLVDGGIINLLKRLCRSTFFEVQEQVANALASLSETTDVGAGTVAALMMLSLNNEEGGLAIDAQQSAVNNFIAPDAVEPSRRKTQSESAKQRERHKMETNFAPSEVGANTTAQVIEIIRQRSLRHSQLDDFSDSPKRSRTDADAYREFKEYLKVRNRPIEIIQIIPGENADLPVSYELKASLFPPLTDLFSYSNVPAKHIIETGGMSKKVPIDLPFPGLQGAEGLDSVPNRMSELREVPIADAPLPKHIGVADIIDDDKGLFGSTHSLISREHSIKEDSLIGGPNAPAPKSPVVQKVPFTGTGHNQSPSKLTEKYVSSPNSYL